MIISPVDSLLAGLAHALQSLPPRCLCKVILDPLLLPLLPRILTGNTFVLLKTIRVVPGLKQPRQVGHHAVG